MSRRSQQKIRRPSKMTIPTGVGPHIRLVFTEMQRQGVTYDDAEWRSGVLRTTIKAWRTKTRPGLETIEAVLGMLGWDLTPVPREHVLDDEIVRELRPIAQRLGLSMPEAIRCAAEIACSLQDRFPPETVHDDPAPLVPTRRAAPEMQVAA